MNTSISMRAIGTAVGFSVIAFAAASAQEMGVTDSTIKIGIIQPLSGPASAYSQIAYTDQAYIKMINDNGGVCGRQIELILWEMAQVQHIEQSAAFASLIEQSLRSRVKMSARAIQQAPFRVLVGANMPAVLVELGFISNPDEEKLLRSPAHQRLLVDALVESIVRFREQLDAPRPTAAGIASGGAPAGPPQPERPREP